MNAEAVQQYQHKTVLLEEAVNALALDGARADGIYVDGTFGRGGHSRKILQHLSEKGRLLAFDKDTQAIANAASIDDVRFDIAHDSFATLADALAARGIGQLDGVLLDLGISSPQVDDAARGFSFRADGPLDMRMDTTRGMSAAEWLATETEQKIEKGDTRIWGRTVCFSDCKGDCCSPGSRANFKHTTACPDRGTTPSKPARKAKTRPLAPFRLSGFSSIKSLRNSK